MPDCGQMDQPPVIKNWPRAELRDLELAKSLLENPGFTIRLANTLGSPIEQGFAMLPKGWNNLVNRATKGALMKALRLAVATLGKRDRRRAKEFFHKVLVGTS